MTDKISTTYFKPKIRAKRNFLYISARETRIFSK